MPALQYTSMYVKHNCQPKHVLLQSRKTYISFEDIFKHIQELQESLSEHKTGECLLQDHKFWTDLCTVLGVPNTSSNRYQLKRAYKDENVKKVQTEEDGREDEAEIEGAEVEKVTQHRSDFHQEDEKEHSNKKDIIQDEDVLKSEGGKKESKKQKEFKQVDINKDDSKEVKAALKEVDEEENAPEIEVVKEEEFTQEMTTFQKEDDKEHTREEDLIQEEEDLTDDIAQVMKNYCVRDEKILFTFKLMYICYFVFENCQMLKHKLNI